MIRNVHRAWFEVWGEEQAQNRILKGLLTLSVLLNATAALAIAWLTTRHPLLIAVTSAQTQVISPTKPSKELLDTEAQRALKHYIAARYTWEWSNIEAHFKDAAALIEPSFVKKFETNTSAQLKLARAKKLSQKFYPFTFSINSETKTARVEGDRILIIDNLRAASLFGLSLSYTIGARTPENPEGVYVTSDEPVADGAGK